MSRSYYGKIIPQKKAGEYFGVYDIFGKGAASSARRSSPRSRSSSRAASARRSTSGSRSSARRMSAWACLRSCSSSAWCSSCSRCGRRRRRRSLPPMRKRRNRYRRRSPPRDPSRRRALPQNLRYPPRKAAPRRPMRTAQTYGSGRTESSGSALCGADLCRAALQAAGRSRRSFFVCGRRARGEYSVRRAEIFQKRWTAGRGCGILIENNVSILRAGHGKANNRVRYRR